MLWEQGRLQCVTASKVPTHMMLVLQVSMNEMMEIIMGFDGKRLPIRHIPGPEGVRGRNSDNALILEKLGWEPTVRLADGLRVTYFWIKSQLEEVRNRGCHVLLSFTGTAVLGCAFEFIIC